MNDTVRYTEHWNHLRMRPKGGYDWLDANQARALYEKRPGPGVMVVGGIDDETGSTFVPRWVIGFGVGPGARVQFYDQHGSLMRLVDYDGVDGRLWRWITVDYVYENDARRWSQDEYVQEVSTSIRPDGSGHLAVVEAADPYADPVRTSSQIQVQIRDSYWLDRPAFGDWDRLADPGPSAREVAGYPAPTPSR